MASDDIETISAPLVEDLVERLDTVEREGEVDPDAERQRILQVQKLLGEQNNALLGQLKLVGKQPTPLMLIKLEHDVLLDFFFGEDSEGREAYNTACHMQLNAELKRALGQHYGIKDEVPSE